MSKSAEFLGFAFITLFTISVALKPILGDLHYNIAFADSIYTASFIFITIAIVFFTIKIWQRVPYWVDLVGFLVLLVLMYYLIDIVF